MFFSEFSKYLESLESTSSRLKLIDILSELFNEVSDSDEIVKICYLVQGRIVPFFVPLEIGMAEKTVASSIAQAFQFDRDEVLMEFDKLGDMGLVAEKSAKQAKVKFKTEKVTINEVFDILTEIANTTGDGAVEKKINLLANLIAKLDVVSIKYIVRIPLGNLRLGIGDPTILDALAKVKLGDKSQRHYLEGAYNRTSDLGLIAKTLWSRSNPVDMIKQVEKLQIKIGNPIRSELCERLPNPEKAIEKMGEVDVQFKFDGFRVQIHKKKDQVFIFSRNLESMTHMFPELIEAAKKQIKAESVILDGEAIAYNPLSDEFLPFQETTKRRRKYDIEKMAKNLPLKSFIFDILYKDGESLIDKPLTERLEILKKTIDGDEVLIPVKSQRISDAKALGFMLEEGISKGLEGVVIKKLTSKYEAGARNFNWVKLKRHQNGELKDTIDCVILGYIVGKGKRTAFGAGALLVGVYDDKNDIFVTVSKIGTGLTDQEWQSIKERAKGLEQDHKPARIDSLIIPSVWLKPELVIEVMSDEITRSPIHTAGAVLKNGKVEEPGFALRFPRLVSFRTADKKAEDATTVKELIEMYNQQGIK